MPNKPAITSEQLRSKLKLKHLESTRRLHEKHPHATNFFDTKNFSLDTVRQHSTKLLGAGALAGMLLLSQPDMSFLPSPQEIVSRLGTNEGDATTSEAKKLIVKTLSSVLPDRARPLTRTEEKFVEKLFASTLPITARATLEGEHLNTTYGYIGLEQHLIRYPGDTISGHGEGEILRQGLAPGKGAWGYFATSRDALTPELVETEKWYAVVQTLYLPDWNTRQPYLKDWYKYRKVVIVNTENGNAVVAAISDSGPAAWTGKHFGGSPEVMQSLGGNRYTKGKVILFFVDDPNNTVPLGPVDINEIQSSLRE
jgi:hypothetical protein